MSYQPPYGYESGASPQHPEHVAPPPHQPVHEPQTGAYPPPPAVLSQPLYPPPPAYPSQPLYPYPYQPYQPGYGQQPLYPPPGYAQPPMGYYGAPPYPAQPDQGSAMAIAGLILGIISIPAAFNVGCGLIFGILGLVFSIMGRRSISQRGLATGGLVCSIVGLSFSVLYVIGIIISVIHR